MAANKTTTSDRVRIAPAAIARLAELDRRIDAIERSLRQQLQALSKDVVARLERTLDEHDLRHLTLLLDHTSVMARESAQLKASRRDLLVSSLPD